MNIKISKELLTEILGISISDILTERLPNNCLFYITDNKETKRRYSPYLPSINIYELVYLCKDWAYKQGFIIDTGFHKYYINQFKANCYGWVSNTIDIKQQFNGCTEYESVFKACQWILDNRKQND